MTSTNQTMTDITRDELLTIPAFLRRDRQPTIDPVVLAFGAGVDSTAILAIALNRDFAAELLGLTRAAIDAAVPELAGVVMADPGAEFPETYKNVEIARELCARAGIPFDVVHKVDHKTGERVTITDWLDRLGTVPVMPGGSHVCSLKFKGEVLAKFVANRFDAAVTWLVGIEANETGRVQRFTPDKNKTGAAFRYPLIDLGLTRDDCERLLVHLWPIQVRKSSCVFCPFMSGDEIADLASQPEQLAIAAQVEARFAETSPRKHQAWLDAGQPLTKRGHAPVGMWRRDSWAEGARLFVKKINGQRLTVQQWAAASA